MATGERWVLSHGWMPNGSDPMGREHAVAWAAYLTGQLAEDVDRRIDMAPSKTRLNIHIARYPGQRGTCSVKLRRVK